MTLEKILVIGAGQMGSGIAQVLVQNNLNVTLQDLNQEALQAGVQNITRNLEKLVSKGKLTETEKDLMLNRLQTITHVGEDLQIDMVIEAAVENVEVKKNIFSALCKTLPKHTILATNTSSLPITAIASVTNRPENVIGMHFMNPVPVMKLVEVIRGLATSDHTYQTVHDLAGKIGKIPIEVNDFPGFISNRILIPMLNEAVFALYEGVATAEAIDSIMKLGMNHPMGPLELADFIGLDTCLYIMETLHEGYGDDKYRPCPLLQKYVHAGWLGRKSGRGFYQYNVQ